MIMELWEKINDTLVLIQPSGSEYLSWLLDIGHCLLIKYHRIWQQVNDLECLINGIAENKHDAILE